MPTPFTGTAVDFAPGDDVEQAIGPDPFKPVPFRAWLWDGVPGAYSATVLDIANMGDTQRDSVLQVHVGSGDIAKDQAERYDRSPPWDKYLDFQAACNTGIRFGADTGEAAIRFEQPHGRAQPLAWNYGAAADGSTPPRQATLSVAPDSGDLEFHGGNIRVDGSVVAAGLSADRQPARNLRGKNVAVKAGETSLAVTFPVAEADGEYAVFVEQSWLSNRAVTAKDAHGFTIQFERPAPEGARLDWMIVR